MSAPPAAAELPGSRSILSPFVDFLCVGGLSLIILIPLLLSGKDQLGFLTIATLVWGQALVNYLHFMASYRMVYRNRDMIRRHRWAAIWVPLILIALILVTIASGERLLLIAFFAVSSGYLAWHYTGQVWGMMASHAYLEGAKFEKAERILIRTSLRILLVWHVTWFLHLTMRDPSIIAPFYRLISAATVLAFLVGAAGLTLMSLRLRRFPPGRSVVAWLAIFAWYAAMARWGLVGLFMVQFFHALQYLEFPLRVEVNRARRDGPAGVVGHLLIYMAILVGASLLVLLIVPGPAMSIAATFLGAPKDTVAPVLVLYLINIHHYFTDGVIWKISNPEVRKDLFAHVAPPQPVKVAAEPPPDQPVSRMRKKVGPRA